MMKDDPTLVLLGLSALHSTDTPDAGSGGASPSPVRRIGDSERMAALSTIVDQLPVGVAAFDIDEALVAWNPAYGAFLSSAGIDLHAGMAYESILRQFYDNAGARQGDRAEDVSLADRLRWHRAPKAPWRVRTADGSWYETEEFRKPDGGFIVLCRDVSEQLKTERALDAARSHAEASNRAKSEFMATMSHELRTPLNAIIGFSEAIADDMLGTLGDSPYRGYAGDILDAGKNLLAIVNDILELSRLEAGEIDLKEDRVELRSLLNGVLLGLRERISRNGIDLVVEVTDEAAVYFVDPRAFRQILHNLVSNAVKFTRPGGRVTITSERQRDRCILIVHDNGIGMTADEIALAVQPFKQLADPMVRSSSGTGLGLPLTKALVELHGGQFDLTSVPGAGTEAKVTLPLTRLA